MFKKPTNESPGFEGINQKTNRIIGDWRGCAAPQACEGGIMNLLKVHADN